VAGAGDEADAEAFEVVIGVVEGVDFEFAAVARTGVDLANGQRLAENREQLVWMRWPSTASAALVSGAGSLRRPWRVICRRMRHIRGRVPRS
jgi:hypothetical protein